jgi:alpha-1,2-mannosyltransferase
VSAGRRSLQIVAVGVLAVAVWVYVTRLSPRPVWHHTFDLRVYRGAVQWWLDGRPLYDFVRPGTTKGFTYPPFAVLCLLPLAIGTETTATVLLTTVSAGLVVLTTWWLVGPVARRHGWPRVFAVGLAVPLVVAMEPVRETLGWGQIDLVVAALVLADVVALRGGRRWAGVGIGLATAIKLTPGVFVVYLALTRRWRAAAVAAGTFAAATLLGVVVDPVASVRYWTSTLWQTGRVGPPADPNDQSLLGLLARVAAPRPPSTALWAALAAVVLVAGLSRAARLQRRGDDLAGFVVTGLVGCLVSPISWVHHLYWVVPAVVVLLDAGTRTARVAAVLVWAVFAGSLLWFFTGRPPGVGTTLGENAYVLLMLALVAALPARVTASPSAARTTGPPRPAGSSPR